MRKDTWLQRIVKGNEKRKIARKGQELILLRKEGKEEDRKEGEGSGEGSDGERGLEVTNPTTISIQIHLNR